MLVTFINNRDEEDSYGPYQIAHLPLPGELVGFPIPSDAETAVYQVVSREYIFKNTHHHPDVTVFIERSA